MRSVGCKAIETTARLLLYRICWFGCKSNALSMHYMFVGSGRRTEKIGLEGNPSRPAGNHGGGWLRQIGAYRLYRFAFDILGLACAFSQCFLFWLACRFLRYTFSLVPAFHLRPMPMFVRGVFWCVASFVSLIVSWCTLFCIWCQSTRFSFDLSMPRHIFSHGFSFTWNILIFLRASHVSN